MCCFALYRREFIATVALLWVHSSVVHAGWISRPYHQPEWFFPANLAFLVLVTVLALVALTRAGTSPRPDCVWPYVGVGASAVAARLVSVLVLPCFWSLAILANLTDGGPSTYPTMLAANLAIEVSVLTGVLYATIRLMLGWPRQLVLLLAVCVSLVSSQTVWTDVLMRRAKADYYTAYADVRSGYCSENSLNVAASIRYVCESPGFSPTGSLDDLLTFETFRRQLEFSLENENPYRAHRLTVPMLCPYVYRVGADSIEVTCPEHPGSKQRVRLHVAPN